MANQAKRRKSGRPKLPKGHAKTGTIQVRLDAEDRLERHCSGENHQQGFISRRHFP
jgi:hypothetical protein